MDEYDYIDTGSYAPWDPSGSFGQDFSSYQFDPFAEGMGTGAGAFDFSSLFSDPYADYATPVDYTSAFADFGGVADPAIDTASINYTPADFTLGGSDRTGLQAPNLTWDAGTGTLVEPKQPGAVEGMQGIDSYSAHNLPGGLTVQAGADGLLTGATADYFGNNGTGLLVDGAPSKVSSLSDVQLLGDPATLDAWSKNSGLSWQDYAASNGYQALAEKLGVMGTSPVLQALQSASQQKAASGASGGGSSGGGGSQPKQEQKTATQSALGQAALIAQLLAALGAKGVKPPKPDAANNKGANAMSWKRFAEGGQVLGAPSGRAGALGLLRGPTTGQSDQVPAKVSHGEYVMDADVVAALGDGNTEAGAAKLDEMRHNIRKHKRSAPANKIPPQAKSPLAYMKGQK